RAGDRVRGGVLRAPALRARLHRAREEAGERAGVPPHHRRVLAAAQGAGGRYARPAGPAPRAALGAGGRPPDAHRDGAVDREGRLVRGHDVEGRRIMKTPHIAPSAVHATLARHMLADGYDLVLDLEKSHGRRLHDARTGRDYLDLFSFFAT